MVFLDQRWKHIGTRDNLQSDLSAITSIEDHHLNQPQTASVAQRMSWASKRETSRIEDLAYCLLSIFYVNMPLLYGEGRKAFMRLQLEIIKKSDDESIFAWTCSATHSGMLAPWPSCFSKSSDVAMNSDRAKRRPYSMTNKGLELHLPKFTELECNEITLSLGCFRHDGNNHMEININLYGSGGVWCRVDCERLLLTSRDNQLYKYHEYAMTSDNTVTVYVHQPGL